MASKRRVIISALLGIAIPWIPGLWFPGMLLAAIVFPQGIHSDYGDAYMILAFAIDFILYGSLAYAILAFRAEKCQPHK
jgi:hypothetical protein